MACRTAEVRGAWPLFLSVVLVVIGLVAPARARAANGLIAVTLLSPEVCTTQDCWSDPLGVVVVSPDGGAAHQLPFRVDEDGEGAAYAPSFSADGRLLAVVVDSVGIAVGSAAASGFRYVYRADSNPDEPAWSPRTHTLVFAAHSHSGAKLIAVSLDSGRHRTLAPGDRPAWSPNGRWIAFTTSSQVRIIRPDGRGRRTVTRCPGESCEVERWSADGRKLLYYDGDNDQWRTVTVATGKSVPVPEPAHQAFLTSPDWRLHATADDRGVYIARRDGADRRRILGPPRQWGAAEYELADWQHLP